MALPRKKETYVCLCPVVLPLRRSFWTQGHPRPPRSRFRWWWWTKSPGPPAPGPQAELGCSGPPGLQRGIAVHYQEHVKFTIYTNRHFVKMITINGGVLSKCRQWRNNENINFQPTPIFLRNDFYFHCQHLFMCYLVNQLRTIKCSDPVRRTITVKRSGLITNKWRFFVVWKTKVYLLSDYFKSKSPLTILVFVTLATDGDHIFIPVSSLPPHPPCCQISVTVVRRYSDLSALQWKLLKSGYLSIP